MQFGVTNEKAGPIDELNDLGVQKDTAENLRLEYLSVQIGVLNATKSKEEVCEEIPDAGGDGRTK